MELNELDTGIFGGRYPMLVAGPCSAESRGQVLATAEALAAQGVGMFRAGVWKPRTKPGGFEGVGSKALAWLSEVKQRTGMRVATEVAMPQHVEEALRAGVDLLWIGARTATSPFAVQELAEALRGADVPVLVKNPANPDLELWIGALERLYGVGLRRLGAIHRGFGAYGDNRYRNAPLWNLPIELKRRYPRLTLFCDPSHIGGRSERVAPLARQAMALHFDGLFIEAHCTPAEALSDSAQQLTPDELAMLMHSLVVRRNRSANGELDVWRQQIDEIDEQMLELLARRMRISQQIGTHKSRLGMPVFQPDRYRALLERRTRTAVGLGLSPLFIDTLMRAIHEESVRIQLEIPHEE